MKISNRNPVDQITFTLDGTTLKSSHELKDVGVTFTSKIIHPHNLHNQKGKTETFYFE